MIWVIGQYADRIENSDVLLEDFLFSFQDEPVEVQLALLTATVKLFIQRPTKGQDIVPKVLKWATEETDNPDLRDRGYMYWRLLSADPATAKKVVMGEKPPITAEAEKLDPATLEEMCLNVGTLATVYLKPVNQVFRNARPKRLQDSPALQRHQLPTTLAAERSRRLIENMMTTPQQQQQPPTAIPPEGMRLTPQPDDNLLAGDLADDYFSGSVATPAQGVNPFAPVGAGGNTGQYVVNQSVPQQMYQHDQNQGDLLLL